MITNLCVWLIRRFLPTTSLSKLYHVEVILADLLIEVKKIIAKLNATNARS